MMHRRHATTRPWHSTAGSAAAQAPAEGATVDAYVQAATRHKLIENCLRPVVLGRNNHLFICDAEAGGKSAVLYSLLASTAAHGVDPQAYLRDVFERLPLIAPTDETALEELRPSVWAAAFKAGREHTSPTALKIA